MIAGPIIFACALGRGGVTCLKREGDGATPRGRFRLHRLWWRDDRMMRPRTGLPTARIRPHHGWCDDVGSPLYNRLIRLPFSPSHEIMRREDHLYDCVIEIGWNMKPVKRGAGSAIFLHVATSDYSPTAGCIAISRARMRHFLSLLGPKTTINIM
ncbi:MAG: L,D-transpeptidase family protein [Beijerinckiaceae bacterium]|nr:L,D-transpeptidase family protein [Beijerinckiaceae bacterium]